MFSNVNKECPGNDNSSKPELILLARNMRYEIEITHRKKSEKKLQSSRPNNLILKDKKKFKKYNIEEENPNQPGQTWLTRDRRLG